MFANGFKKVAKFDIKNAEHLEHAGLGMLALPSVYHGAKALKERKEGWKGEAAHSAAEIGGLGILSRATRLAHKGH